MKYQGGGRSNDYAQKPVDGPTFVRGATFAKPISMGVSINETWSYQIYNYTGIGYYPATPPQPWPPAPPAAKSQTLGTSVDPTQMGGVALPAKPPDRDSTAMDPWPSPLPEWVIYPVAKSVTKNYIVQQSTETFVNQTVAITAGPRSHPKVKHTLQPERTTPSDVMWYVDANDKTASSYPDGTGAVQPLASNAVYDRNLLTDPNTQFSATQFPTGVVDTATAGAWNKNSHHNVPPAPPTDPGVIAANTVAATGQLAAWILGGTPLSVGAYNKIPQTWSETHVSYQATLVRADCTLSDTVVAGSQNTMVNAGTSNTHTNVTGQQHTILHTGSTLTETTVDGEQTTRLDAGSTYAHTDVSGLAASVTNQAMSSAVTNVGMSSAITNNLMSFSMTNTAMAALALKAALVDLSITAALKHFGMNIGICFDITVGPHFTMKLAQMGVKASDLDLTAATKDQMATFHNIF